MDTVKVFVVDAEGKPLLPTHPARARKLLDAGTAQVYQVVPFAIQLTYVVDAPVGAFTVGIDDGATEVGIGVINEVTSEVVAAGTIQLRQDVPRKMASRRLYRRARRYRQTRYRAPRSHRSKGEGWLPPTIRQKKDSVVRVVLDLKRLVNITKVIIEEGAFDTASLAAGRQLHGVEYQIPRYTGRAFRAKVLWRDHYTCQHCGGHTALQAHHLIPQADGGTDTPENGLTLCAICHAALHRGEWALTQRPPQWRYPAHLQSGKTYLRQRLLALGWRVETVVGWMTAYWRGELGLDKTHVNDAVALVCRTYVPHWRCRPYLLVPKRKKVWAANPTKTCEEKHGFRHWDLVKAQHRTRGTVIGSVRSLKATVMTLRTAWDDNFAVSYRKSKLLWRFSSILYI